MMKASEAIVLEAVLLALPQVSDDLAGQTELAQQIRQIGAQLPQDPSAAIGQLQAVLETQPELQAAYQASRMQLRQQYPARERETKYWFDGVANAGAANLDLSLEAVAVLLLTTADFRQGALALVKQLRSRRQFAAAPEDLKGFLDLLERAAHPVDAQTLEILQALERQPLTVEGLAYGLDLSVERVRSRLRSLWQARYIDPVAGSIWRRILPFFKPSSADQAIDDTTTYFTLTARGHFRLHPLLGIRQPAKAALR